VLVAQAERYSRQRRVEVPRVVAVAVSWKKSWHSAQALDLSSRLGLAGQRLRLVCPVLALLEMQEHQQR